MNSILDAASHVPASHLNARSLTASFWIATACILRAVGTAAMASSVYLSGPASDVWLIGP